jgi:hypothetical protein
VLLPLKAWFELRGIRQLFPGGCARIFRNYQQRRAMGVHLDRSRRLCVLIYFDFIGKSVRYFHVFCLDLLPQNTDHIALVVLPVLPFTGNSWGGPYTALPTVSREADQAFCSGFGTSHSRPIDQAKKPSP